jgi:integrase
LTGLRSGELWTLRRKDVDLLRGSIHVRRALKEHYSTALPPDERGLRSARRRRTATGSCRCRASCGRCSTSTWHPSPAARTRSSSRRRAVRPSGTVCSTAAGSSPPSTRRFRRSCRACAFTTLRHTCASLSISKGAHPLLVKQRLGHSSIEITMDRYGHLFPSAEQALCAGLDAAYEESSSPAENVLKLTPR